MKKIVNKLKKLKKLGMSGVKLSLEDEGSTFEDLKIMSKNNKILKFKFKYKNRGM